MYGCLPEGMTAGPIEFAQPTALPPQNDQPTDVLSFDLSECTRRGCVDGEIVVSAETAARRAEGNEHTPAAELLLYIVHGCLHLAGHDDRTPAGNARMHAVENEILTALGYGPVFGEVQP